MPVWGINSARTMSTEQAFETKAHDMSGRASLDIRDIHQFYTFFAQTAGYDKDRYEPVALKIFMQGRKPVLTLFALDKTKKSAEGKLPVKKFKLPVSWPELFSWVKRFDMVLSTGFYEVGDMVVVNK